MKKIQIPTFVKWAGGKTQLLKQFECFLPTKIERYFEPFVGSGAVFFYIRQTRHPKYCMISDNNRDLMNLYMTIKNDLDEFLPLLEKYRREHKKNPKEYYYRQRQLFNNTKNRLEKSALFIYLNKTCFNGLYRVNSKGEFNVPFGSYKNPAIVQKEKLKLASKLLNEVKVEIKSMNFLKISQYARKRRFYLFQSTLLPFISHFQFYKLSKRKFLRKRTTTTIECV